jgi:hypothetical protein
MGIFKRGKEERGLNPKLVKENKRFSFIFRSGMKIGCGVGLAFNAIMMFMLLIRGSPLSFLFLINLVFLIRAWKKGFKEDA